MLDGPDGARARLGGDALHVAVAQRPDFRPRARLADEGVVSGDAAVGVDADGLAHVRAEILGLRPHRLVGALAQGDEQLAVGRKGQRRAEMLVAVIGGLGVEEGLNVLDLRQVVRQAAARHRRAVAAFTRLGVAPVDHPVLRERRPDDDVQQPALAARIDGGQAGDGLADLALGADDAHPPRPLGHQPLAVRQQGQAPGVNQTRGRDCVRQRRFGADSRRARLAFEGRLLVRVVGGAGLDRRAWGVLSTFLAIGPAGGGENEERGGSGEDERTHEALLNSRCRHPEWSLAVPCASRNRPRPIASRDFPA
ncbi:hypothetical protein D3C72_1285670 [compost metagenome]